MLFVVSGASGVGKSSLCAMLLDRFDELVMSVSYTTRAPRGAEEDGVHYHFVDDARFDAMVAAGEFAEWAHVHGNRYGTAKKVVSGELEAGRSVLFDIDYQGAASLVAAYPQDSVTTMVLPPSMETLESRLRGRGTDAEDVIARRMAKARAEISHAPSFDYLLVNDDLEEAYRTIEAIYRAGRNRTRMQWPRLAERFVTE